MKESKMGQLKIVRFVIGSFLGSLLLTAVLHAAGPTPLFVEGKGADNYKLIFIPKTPVPPVLDGKLDDAAWKLFKPNSDFGNCAYGARRFPFPQTKAQYLWDQDYLYVAITCEEDSAENFARVKRFAMDKSKPIYSRDCIELHIDGNNDNATRFQVWFNPAHEKSIFWHYDFGWGILTNQNYGLSANWDYAVHFGKQSWTIEARLALAHIQIKPHVGYIFGMNPTRFRFDKRGTRNDGKLTLEHGVSHFLSWSTQGGDHHDASLYGKCVLVQKQPKSLKEGLKLAYPDLDQRKVMIQTPAGFTVFDHGKQTQVTYTQKLQQELANVRALMKKTNALLENPQFVKNYLARSFKQSQAKVIALEKEISKLPQSISAVDLGKFRKSLGKVYSVVEPLFWVARRQLLLAGKEHYQRQPPAAKRYRVPREEPENTPDPKTRKTAFVSWAKDTPAVRALIIAAEGSSWTSYALMKRMNLDADIYVATGRIPKETLGPQTDYYREGIRLFPEKKRQLKNLLRNHYDVVVFVDFMQDALPGDIQYELTGWLMAGTPMVNFQSRPWSFVGLPQRQWKNDTRLLKTIPANHFTKLIQDSFVLDSRGMPLDTYDRKLVKKTLRPIRKIKVGKGVYTTFRPGGVRYYFSGGFTPLDQQDPDEYFQAEYYYSLAAKIILDATGRLGNWQIAEVASPTPTQSPGTTGSMRVSLQGPDFKGVIKTVVRNRLGRVLRTNQIPVQWTGSKKMASVLTPALDAGAYYLDAFLQKDGRQVGWASGRFVVADSPTIQSIKLTSRTVRKGETLVGKVHVANPPAKATLRVALRDIAGRIVQQLEGIPVDADEVHFELPITRTWFTYSKLDVFLVNAQHVAEAVKTVEVFTPSHSTDEFTIFTDGEGANAYGHLRQQILRDYGCNLLQVNLNPVDILASGADLNSRYWISHSLNETGGSLASEAYHRGLTKTMHLLASILASRGGRFISTGDDSGVAEDFVKNYPNWVMPLIGRFAKKYPPAFRASDGALVPDRDFCTKRGLPYQMHWRWLWRTNLAQLVNMKLQPGDLDIFKASFKEAYPNIAVFNRANGTTFTSFDKIQAGDLKKINPPFSPDIIGFQDWLKDKYKTINQLNAAWGASEKSFETIAAGRLVGTLLAAHQYGAQLDKLQYLEDLFIGHMKTASNAVHDVAQEIGIGQGAGSFLNIIPQVLKHTDTYAPYLENVGIEIGRSMPHRWIGQTLGVYGGKAVTPAAREHQVWHLLFTGGNFMWFWSASDGALMGDLSTNPNRAGIMLQNIQEAKRGIAASLIRAKRQHDGIAILTSRTAGHMSSIVKTLSTHHASKELFQYLIEDQGLQYLYIDGDQLANGRLDQGDFQLLVLPDTQILTPKQIKAIRKFVQTGGTIMADFRPGIYDVHGRPRKQGALDDLFGITGAMASQPVKGALRLAGYSHSDQSMPGWRSDGSVIAKTAKPLATLTSQTPGSTPGLTPTLLVHRAGQGQAILLNLGLDGYQFLLNSNQLGLARQAFTRLFKQAGIEPQIQVVSDHRAVPGVERAIFERGDVQFLTVEKKSLQYETGSVVSQIKLDRPCYVTNMRTGEKLGRTDTISVSLAGLSCHVWSLLPYEVTGLKLEIPATIHMGEDLLLQVALQTPNVLPSPHVIRIEAISPSGKTPFDLRKPDTLDGHLAYVLPIAFNEEPGPWTIRVTDVYSGQKAEKICVVLP